MKKKKKKMVIFIIIIGIMSITLFNIINNKVLLNNIYHTIFGGYATIKLDTNENYDGIGQQSVDNEDGYFTTFTTSDDKTYKEYKQNGDSTWSNKEYWNGEMKDTGCGITVLSIILSGYGYNYTPEDLREKYYPVMDYTQLSDELSNTYEIKNSDFYFDSVHLSSDSIIKHLESGRPIIVCVWSNGEENRWTSASHYMALLATDGNMVYVSNPNGLKNNSKSSGWYNIEEITPYIAKALYIESY